MLLDVDDAELLSCGTVLEDAGAVDDAGAVELLPAWLELELFVSLLLEDELEAGADDELAGAAEF